MRDFEATDGRDAAVGGNCDYNRSKGGNGREKLKEYFEVALSIDNRQLTRHARFTTASPPDAGTRYPPEHQINVMSHKE